MDGKDQVKEDLAFFNKWIDIKDLPLIEEAEFVGLEPEYVYVRLSNVLILSLLGGVPMAIFIFLSSLSLTAKFVLLGTFVVIMSVWAVIIILEFKFRGYAIRTHDVAYRSGYLFRRRQYLPFRRVQHCKITEGLVERLFNFSTVIISAAGDDIAIHGLRPDEALKLQQFVNDKVDELTKEMHYGRK